MVKIKLNITGMHCASCSKLIEIELEDKVKSIKINDKNASGEIDFDEKNISKKEIIETITKLGYGVT